MAITKKPVTVKPIKTKTATAKRSLTKEHRSKISQGLILHHKRKRRAKTKIGRLINKFTKKTNSQTHRELRANKQKKINSGKQQAAIRLRNQIHDKQFVLQKLRANIQQLSKQKASPSVNSRKDQLHKQADMVVRQLQQLRKQKSALLGNPT